MLFSTVAAPVAIFSNNSSAVLALLQILMFLYQPGITPPNSTGAQQSDEAHQGFSLLIAASSQLTASALVVVN